VIHALLGNNNPMAQFHLTVARFVYRSQSPQTRAKRCITSSVLYTKVDARCDKLATVVGRTKLTTLAAVDVAWRNFSKSRAWNKVPEGSTDIFRDIRIPL